jgi:hypothetical protein
VRENVASDLGKEYGFAIGDVRVKMKQGKTRKDAAPVGSNKGLDE